MLRAWERCSVEQKEELRYLFRHNAQLARAYQIVDELRMLVRCAPDAEAMKTGLDRVLRRTQRHANKHLRALHDSLRNHWGWHPGARQASARDRADRGLEQQLGNADPPRPRRAQSGDYLLLKLRFMVANPLHSVDGIERFLALGLPVPMRARA